MAGGIGFEVNLGAARGPADRALRRSNRRHILVLGDFTGRRNRGVETTEDLERRPVLSVDIDRWDAVLARLSPALRFGAALAASSSPEVVFRSLDDFHPDRLLAAMEPFRRLRESRARLGDPALFEREADRLMANAAPASPGVQEPASEGASDLLQRLIGSPAAADPAAATAGAVDSLIRRLVQPHIRPGPSRSPAPFLAAVDASLSETMRTVLHDPDFQELEATWRGLRDLVDALDPDEAVSVQLVDVSRGELLADLAACAGDATTSAAHRLLARGCGSGADAEPWSLLVGHFTFGADLDDLELLGHLGAIAAHAGAPLLAAAAPSLVGCAGLEDRPDPRQWAIADATVAQRWDDLRRGPAARWIGLLLPRILLRLPYGAGTDAIETFRFEELPPSATHEDCLWGNPALACARAIGAAWRSDATATTVDGPLEIDDLPAHVREVDGERRLQPCAEVLLPLSAGEEILRRGVMPWLSFANRNAVRLIGVRSIADPPAPLA